MKKINPIRKTSLRKGKELVQFILHKEKAWIFWPWKMQKTDREEAREIWFGLVCMGFKKQKDYSEDQEIDAGVQADESRIERGQNDWSEGRRR